MKPIVWHDDALDKLADYYVAAELEEREEIAKTVEAINRGLQNSPAQQGESRSGRIRVTFYGSMTVKFEPANGHRPTQVLMVQWKRRRRR